LYIFIIIFSEGGSREAHRLRNEKGGNGGKFSPKICAKFFDGVLALKNVKKKIRQRPITSGASRVRRCSRFPAARIRRRSRFPAARGMAHCPWLCGSLGSDTQIVINLLE
jgi:hypothetical protein